MVQEAKDIIPYHTINQNKSGLDSESIESTSYDFNFSYQLFLDRNTFNDKTYFKSQTIIDHRNSFYSPEPNEYTNCFINIYFDLVELARRDMDSVLQQKLWVISETDSIFTSTIKKLDVDLKEYLKLVRQGNNETMLKTYIDKIYRTLDVDNALLIQERTPIKINDKRLAKLRKESIY